MSPFTPPPPAPSRKHTQENPTRNQSQGTNLQNSGSKYGFVPPSKMNQTQKIRQLNGHNHNQIGYSTFLGSDHNISSTTSTINLKNILFENPVQILEEFQSLNLDSGEAKEVIRINVGVKSDSNRNNNNRIDMACKIFEILKEHNNDKSPKNGYSQALEMLFCSLRKDSTNGNSTSNSTSEIKISSNIPQLNQISQLNLAPWEFAILLHAKELEVTENDLQKIISNPENELQNEEVQGIIKALNHIDKKSISSPITRKALELASNNESQEISHITENFFDFNIIKAKVKTTFAPILNINSNGLNGIYTGNTYKGMPFGKGTFVDNNRVKYEGCFSIGLPENIPTKIKEYYANKCFTITQPNGIKISSPIIVHENQFVPHGKGKITYPDNRTITCFDKGQLLQEQSKPTFDRRIIENSSNIENSDL